MTDLPPGWARTTLADLGVQAQPGCASGANNRLGTGVVHLRPMNVSRDGRLDLRDVKYVEDKSDRRIQHGDVMFNNTNSAELVGKTAYVQAQTPLAFSNHMTRLRPRHGLDAGFLAHQLHALWMSGYFQRICSNHVNQASVATRRLLETELAVPPLVEQRQIVGALEAHLSRLEAALVSLDAGGRRLRTAREQVMRMAALGLLGHSTQPEFDKHFDEAKDDWLPILPPGWHWGQLGQIADMAGGVTKDSSKQLDASYVDVPYLRVANVQKARLDLTDVTTIRVPPQKAAALALVPGDVLLNEGGDRDKLGRGWVWEGQIDNCIHQNHVLRARIRENLTDPYLLSWYANTVGRRWCERNGRQSVNLASISLSKISQMPVPLPQGVGKVGLAG